MQAVRIHRHGDFEVLGFEDLPLPEPGPGQVRIQVAWSALNHLDTWVRRGVPGHRFPLPLIPGCDFSGVVDRCGPGVASVEVGQRVAVAPGFSCGHCLACTSGRQQLCRKYGIYGETTDGGNAEFAVVQEENLMPVPDGYPLDLAAAFPLTFLTAWHMLVDRCQVQPGDRVLIHAAGAGVSVAATQIAKLWGAEVMVTAGTEEKVARGLENGADHGCCYRNQDWTESAKAWAKPGGLDIVVDHVGADTLPKGIWLLNKGGRVVTCGVTSGAEMKLHFAPIFFKGLSVLGSTMGSLGEQKKVASLIFSGKLTPVVHQRFAWRDVQQAHRSLAERQAFGKVLLQVNPDLT
ncbi:MAG: alcohol dehydrogenase [Planctomycetota bacterium]|nr:MAG: alcohol dehydrogenase [Planctomycetota bacterium]